MSSRLARAWRTLPALAAVCAACSPVVPDTEASRGDAVVIDGRFDDWTGAQAVADPADAPRDAPDFRALRARHDASYVYLQLDLERPANLLGLASPVTIAFDADGDARTGWSRDGLPGTDLAIDLTRLDSLGRAAQGVAVRTAAGTFTPYAVDYVALPSYAAERFELRVARRTGGAGGDAPFAGRRFRARVTHRDAAGRVVDETPVLEHPLDAPPRAPALPPQPTDPLARAPGTTLRVVQWNTADHGLIERPQHFRRILQALDPDVVLLDEVNGKLGATGLSEFVRGVGREHEDGRWRAVLGRGGGYQRSAIASRNTVTEINDFRAVPYPDSIVARLLAMAPPARRAALRSSLGELVPTGGAVVELSGRRLAAFVMDLQSAGNDTAGWQEHRRRAEAWIVREQARRALTRLGPVDAVVVAGDLNLVGSRRPLDILAGAPLDRGARLAIVPTLQLDGRTAATWEGRGEPYPPGRLDWMLYSPGSLRPLRGFSLDTRDLDPRWLRAHGLEAEDSRRASDHLPTVVDFAWR